MRKIQLNNPENNLIKKKAVQKLLRVTTVMVGAVCVGFVF